MIDEVELWFLLVLICLSGHDIALPAKEKYASSDLLFFFSKHALQHVQSYPSVRTSNFLEILHIQIGLSLSLINTLCVVPSFQDEKSILRVISNEDWLQRCDGELCSIRSMYRYQYRASQTWKHGRICLCQDLSQCLCPFVYFFLCCSLCRSGNLWWRWLNRRFQFRFLSLLEKYWHKTRIMLNVIEKDARVILSKIERKKKLRRTLSASSSNWLIILDEKIFPQLVSLTSRAVRRRCSEVGILEYINKANTLLTIYAHSRSDKPNQLCRRKSSRSCSRLCLKLIKRFRRFIEPIEHFIICKHLFRFKSIRSSIVCKFSNIHNDQWGSSKNL